ncbi:diacylglycerol kinase family protein [Arthrobacter monumenti]
MTSALPQQHIAVAINPRAAFGASHQVGRRVLDRLRSSGVSVAALQEKDYQSLERAVAREVSAGVDALVVVGGDGMVHLGANVLAGSSIPLGIVASGTGNDVARTLGLPRKNPEAGRRALAVCAGCSAALPRREVTRGAGAVHQAEIPVLSAGFDAVVNERANTWSWPKGRSRYNGAILRELATFRPRSYSVTVNGRTKELAAVLISVANGQSMGGGMKIAPEARYDDGELDLLVVSPLSRLRFLAVFPKVFSGRHVGHPAVRIQRVSAVELDAPGIVAYADGERIGPLPVTVQAAPAALRILACG